MNEVLISVNNVKLNKEANWWWIKDAATAKATGKQGAKHPPLLPNTTTTYLYKTSELSQGEVKQLIERYSCPLCCRNSYLLHDCNALKSTYNISLKGGPTPSTTTSSSEPTVTPHPTSNARANRVTDIFPMSIMDESQRYDGWVHRSSTSWLPLWFFWSWNNYIFHLI